MSHELHPHLNYSKHCIHAKNVVSLLDTPKTLESFKVLSKHAENCSICSEEFKKNQLHSVAAKIFIPKAIMGKDLRQSFEREVEELFNVMDLNNRNLLKKNMKKGFRFFDSMGTDFLKSLVSSMMIKTYFFALILFITLKYFFN